MGPQRRATISSRSRHFTRRFSSLTSSGVLGKLRAQLRCAAIDALRDGPGTAGAMGAHPAPVGEANVLAHLLVHDFLRSQPLPCQHHFDTTVTAPMTREQRQTSSASRRVCSRRGASDSEPLVPLPVVVVGFSQQRLAFLLSVVPR